MSTNPNKSRLMEVLKVLQEKPCSALEIGERANMPRDTVRRHLTALHQSNEIHIVQWVQLNDGPPMRVFALGFGIDAQNPYKERREGPERRTSLTTKSAEREFDNKVARAEARRWADRAAAGETTCPMVAALFGRSQQQGETA